MHISTSENNSDRSVHFNDQEVEFSELPNITRNKHYSNISFKDGYRKGDNFQGVSVLILDIDDGFSIEEVKKKLDGYRALIVTTKSHQAKVKNGMEITPGDRYRLFLALEASITDASRYKTTVTALIEEFQADNKCNDLARFYYCNPLQEIHYLEGEKYWDISQYQSIEKKKERSPSKKIDKESLITDEDGNTMSVNEWFTIIEDDSVMLHCPFSPESHKNNDANASCSMRKNGNYLNMHCFVCEGKQSFHFGEKISKHSGRGEFTYSVKPFDNELAVNELAQGMNTMTEIVSELVRLLPELDKKEKKDD